MLLTLGYSVILLNPDLVQINKVPLKKTNDRIISMTCCRHGLPMDMNTTYLLACDMYLDEGYSDYNPSDLPRNFTGKNMMGYNACLMKVTLCEGELRFVCDYKVNAMLVRNEYVVSVLEFAENRLLVSAQPE